MLSEGIQTIGIFRALQLGDLLCAIPAIRGLREKFPQARITIIGLPWQKQLPELFPDYFDSFLWFPGYPGLPEQPYKESAFAEFKKQMKSLQFDLLLQMQGNGSIVNEMLSQLGAKTVAGFTPSPAQAGCTSSRTLTDCTRSPVAGGRRELWMPYPEDIPEPERHVRLMQYLGVPCESVELEFPVTEKDVAEYLELTHDFQSPYVCIHPGSRGSWRQWPPSCFAQIADRCYQMGFTVCITGTAGEKEITRSVIKLMQYPANDFTGLTSLGGLGCLIRHAELLVANCTGVSHIASATQTPSIIISMDGEPVRWGPLNRQIHHVIDWTISKNHEECLKRALALLPSMLPRQTEIDALSIMKNG